jgi:hypothetical protein
MKYTFLSLLFFVLFSLQTQLSAAEKYEIFLSPGMSLYNDCHGYFFEGGAQTSLNIIIPEYKISKYIMLNSSIFYEGFSEEYMTARHLGIDFHAGYFLHLNEYAKVPKSIQSLRIVPQAGIGVLYQKAETEVVAVDNWSNSGFAYKASFGFVTDCRMPVFDNVRFGLKLMWHRTSGEIVLKYINPGIYASWEF